MTALITTAIMAGAIIAICLLLVRTEQKQKRKAMNRILSRVNSLESKYNLGFSSQEILKNCVIGMDGLRRKILVINSDENTAPSFVLIDLNEVKCCSVKKQYGTIQGGALKKKPLEQYLQSIELHFELANDKPPVDVLLYDHRRNNVSEIRKLEEKARRWETLISKMQMPSEKRA
jgi:hypothetical protein